MIRLLGFLLGSALSIGALLLLLGLPKLTALSEPEIVQELEPISQQATEVKEEVVELAEEVANEIRAAIEDLPPVTNESARQDAPKVPGTVDEVPGTVVVANNPEERAILSEPLVPGTVEEGPGALQWQAFWNPFRSKIAANGFVAQLERVTGLDYRVVRIKPGRYEVAFAYLNDTERRTKLSQIEAATGLELSQ